jgi:hypothetical protein
VVKIYGVKKIIDYILERELKYVAIIGLAKNAGKTVTFNNLVVEARAKGLKLALFSYGRDGEEVDAITLKKKPRIYVPPRDIFATTEQAFYVSNLNGTLLTRTGIDTLLGEVNIYQSGSKGGYVELVGINSVSRLQEMEKLVPGEVDLVLIDGALDRRSSAMPTLAEGIILATGAVIGNTEQLVVSRTLAEIQKLTLPAITDTVMRNQVKEVYSEGNGGIVPAGGELLPLTSKTSFGSVKEIIEILSKEGLKEDQIIKLRDIEAIILNGALINSFVEKLLQHTDLKDFQLVVRDGTRVFLDKARLNLLERRNIKLKVFNPINLIAVTVNPVSPCGARLSSRVIVNKLRQELKDIPVYDVMSNEYYH